MSGTDIAAGARAALGEEERHAAALASLGAGPRRLRRFLEHHSPSDAWRAVALGTHPADSDHSYRAAARDELLEAAARACERCGASVLVHGSPGYPAALAGDREAPAVLFALGDATSADAGCRVAVVGTRSATAYGRGVAAELGRLLAEAGVAVVSGLARGVDSAAHHGAIGCRAGAPPIGVLGTALDAPLGNPEEELRRSVAARGAVVSELPPGVSGAPAWWFAVRNRVMAAMAHVVVVVECHRRGGALHTVRYAAARSIPVAAVPGSVRSPASAGTNALLVDGARPVRHADDVLALLERAVGRDSPAWRPGSRRAQRLPARPRAAAPNAVAAQVLAVLEHDPVALDTVVRRCGVPLAEVALALEQLADAGLAEHEAGWWSVPRA